MMRRVWWSGALVAGVLLCAGARAQTMTLQRGATTVVVEPYAENIVRVSISILKDDATAAAGYGITAKPAASGWTQEASADGDTLRSGRMSVTVGPEGGQKYAATGTQADIAKFFSGSVPGLRIAITGADGRMLLQMKGWEMSVPNHKEGNADILYDRRPTDPPFYQVGATFVSPRDEHYYGLGQNHEGYLDRRGHAVRCAHDYNAPAGPSVCVPFVVTNKGYGLMWDNPGKTTVQFGFNEVTKWTSDVGQRVSFFVIEGKTYDEIYEGYKLLTGDVPMLPKAAYGYIQCKQRYTTQAELLAVAKGYRDRKLPADVLVIDWFHYTEDGRDGHRPGEVAGPSGDES